MSDRIYGLVVLYKNKPSTMFVYNTKEKAEKHALNINQDDDALTAVFVDRVMDWSWEDLKSRIIKDLKKKAQQADLTKKQFNMIFGNERREEAVYERKLKRTQQNEPKTLDGYTFIKI